MVRVLLRMRAETALKELFDLAHLDFIDTVKDIIRAFLDENDLNQVERSSLFVVPGPGEQPLYDEILLHLEVRHPGLLEAVVASLENRLLFDLAVKFHEHSGGRRCYLRDLAFEVLEDQLE